MPPPDRPKPIASFGSCDPLSGLFRERVNADGGAPLGHDPGFGASRDPPEYAVRSGCGMACLSSGTEGNSSCARVGAMAISRGEPASGLCRPRQSGCKRPFTENSVALMLRASEASRVADHSRQVAAKHRDGAPGEASRDRRRGVTLQDCRRAATPDRP